MTAHHHRTFGRRSPPTAHLPRWEDRYRAVAAQADEGFILFDAATTCLLEANAAFCRLLDYRTEDIPRLTLHDIIAHDPASIDTNVARIVAIGRATLGERLYRRRDGTLVPVHVTAMALPAAGGAVLCAVVCDLRERKAAESALATICERERLHLARELHDNPVQQLVALRYRLASHARRLARDQADPRPAGALAAEVNQLADVIGQLRAVIRELRPAGLCGQGLPALLAETIDTFRDAWGGDTPPIALDASDADASIAPEVANCLIRVAREALHNARRHAMARRLIVRVRVRSGVATIGVLDDGRGFIPPPQLAAFAACGHFGLAGLGEMLGDVDGRLRIVSALGCGTIVLARVPLGDLVRQERRHDGSIPPPPR